MSLRDDALKLHEDYKGKLSTNPKFELDSTEMLSLAYSPGVAEPCLEIVADKNNAYKYTIKSNTVGVVTNGTAVLGLGNIGALASLPVMEGKAILFKKFANVDAFPICIDSTDVEKIVETVKLISSTFGGINLEDIAAPTCFEVEERLKKELNIPVFHDDQHGTAIVVVAALTNALKVVHKNLSEIKVVVNGAGSAGVAIIQLLMNYGVNNISICDRYGELFSGKPEGTVEIRNLINTRKEEKYSQGSLADALNGADVFIGVSVAGILKPEMIQKMNKDAIIFAMANPTPEIFPDEALKAGARIVGTGRSDFPNQVNNILAFPGVFRGALDVQATAINEEMKVAAVTAIASLIDEKDLSDTNIISNAFDERVVPAVAKAVAEAAIQTGVAKQ